jgi:head-tail adaptor
VNSTPDIWMDVRRIHFEKRGLPSPESVEGEGISTLSSFQLRCRYAAEITTQLRLLHSGQVWHIEEVVDPDGLRQELLVKAVHREE